MDIDEDMDLDGSSAMRDRREGGGGGGGKGGWGGTFGKQLWKWLTGLVLVFLGTMLYLAQGSLVLFVCKVAQANLLPTDTNCAPFTNLRATVSPIAVNAFPAGDNTSAKLEFPWPDAHWLLDMMRQYKAGEHAHFLVAYWMSLFEDTAAFNYGCMSTVLNGLHQTLPESALLLLGPILTVVGALLVWLVDFVVIVYLYFAHFRWFFRTKVADGSWKEVTLFQPVQYMMAWWFCSVFFCLFFLLFPFAALIPLLATTWCLCSVLGYVGMLDGMEMGAWGFVRETFRQYQGFVLSVAGLAMVYWSFRNTGTALGMATVVAFVAIYVGLISLDWFASPDADGLPRSPLSSYAQAAKKCPTPAEQANDGHGWIYHLLFGKPSSLRGGAGGGEQQQQQQPQQHGGGGGGSASPGGSKRPFSFQRWDALKKSAMHLEETLKKNQRRARTT